MDSIRDEGGLDRRTLERLYVKLEKPMFNVVYRWLWNAEDAEEVIMEAFLKVWRARERVELTSVEALLYKTALNLASNRRRSARLWRWLGLETVGDEPMASEAPDASTELEKEDTRRRVRQAIDALPEALRRVVMLCEYAEMSYEEVGKVLGIPAGTVGSRRNAALAKLADALGPIEGLSP